MRAVIVPFKKDDSGYKGWLKDNPRGYVYNDFYEVLHRSACPTLQLSTTGTTRICSANLQELLVWLKQHRGPQDTGYHPDEWCQPLEDCAADIHRPADSTQRARHRLESPERVSNAVPLIIAQRLIQIYTERKLPSYTEIFYKPLGYTKQEMEYNPNKLYSLILLAAYDRQPFTWVARGWELIWGTRNETDSLRALLSGLGLLELETAHRLPLDRIRNLLGGKRFHGYRIDTDRGFTDYARTIKDTAYLVNERQLLSLMINARNSQDVEGIFRLLDDIHGIGKTIASKIVMYTLREIAIGQIQFDELYPAVKPILDEYYNARMVSELERKFGANIIVPIYECMRKLGDPFAIDALYYIDRDEPELRGLLFHPE